LNCLHNLLSQKQSVNGDLTRTRHVDAEPRGVKVSVADILKRLAGERADVLKIDCERRGVTTKRDMAFTVTRFAPAWRVARRAHALESFIVLEYACQTGTAVQRELASTIEMMLDDPRMRAQLGRSAIETARSRFSPVAAVQCLEDWYRQTASK
jgi:hypothetical protein